MKRSARRAWERERRIWSVYALVDPRNGAVRYVGLSSDARRRLQQHVKDGYSKSKFAWIKELSAANLQPTLVRLEVFVALHVEARQTERAWIERLRRLGHPLLNVAKIRRAA